MRMPINHIAFSKNYGLACGGYLFSNGIILKSTDNFTTYQQIDIESIGYVVGEQGSILKTNNAGLSWQYLRKANTLAQKRYRFTAVCFTDELTGYLTGENGTLWQTFNGGESWQIETIDKKHDYTAIEMINGNPVLVGENGIVVKLILR